MKYLLLIIIINTLFIYYFHNKKVYNYNYNDELWIYNNFYSTKELNEIENILNQIELKKKTKYSSRINKRLYFNDYKRLYQLIFNKKIKKIYQEISFKNNLKNIPTFPIEYRKYPNKSFGLDWHKDLSLFYPDCYEVVLTLSNSSDMKFLWKENNITKSIKPKKNTIVIVKPNSVIHSVTPSNIGCRYILKFILEQKDSKPINGYFQEIAKN